MSSALHRLKLACLAFGIVLLPSLHAQETSVPRIGDHYTNASVPKDLHTPRPIPARDTVFIEEMTWMEVRDAVSAGKTRILIPTGGIEQNGPYLALGKHNFVLRQDCNAIARRLGDTLVAPIVPFVPEGHHEPKTHHMRYPGTISVTHETFERLLIDIATSFQVHGFQQILFLGDSGDNQAGMHRVAQKLQEAWADKPCEVHYVPAYYDPAAIRNWLETRGIKEVDEGLHDRYRYGAQIMTVDPDHIRFHERVTTGHASINGVSLLPLEKTQAIGWQLIAFQAERTVEAIQALSTDRPTQAKQP